MTRQDLADKLTDTALTEMYGERYTNLDNLEDDKQLSDEWDYLNNGFYNTLAFCYGED